MNPKQLFSSLIAGIVSGLLLATIILYICQMIGYPVWDRNFFLLALFGCAFVACADLFKYRELSLWVIECIMIGVSFVTMVFYAYSVALDWNTQQTMMTMITSLHAVILVVTVIRLLIKTRKEQAK